MRTKKRKNPSLPGFLLKLILAVLLVFFMFLIATILLETISDNNMLKDSTTYMNWCDDMFYKKDYTGIREELELYHLNGEEFDTYWEIVDGYADYLDYEQWCMTTEEMVAGSSKKVEEYKQKVIKNAENCAFSRNQKQLTEWKEAVETGK